MKRSTLLVIVICLVALLGTRETFAQRGKITKAATSVPAILDPNQDGFVSKTTTGFSNDGYYVDEFEVKMFGIPKLTGDVAGDNIGKNCGITDLIPDSKGHSVYAVRDAQNNLIFRFRVGDDNPSVESWSILLDIDGLFGASDLNATTDNPGFEVNITLIKNPNSGVWVYNIDGIDNCPSPSLSYSLSTNFQISIADEVSCGDPDYFYDFFVPFGPIASLFGINESSGVRFAAVSNVSATCAMAGKIADISGVDYNEYKSCIECAFTELVDNQCPTAISDLCETCGGFEKEKVNKPTIDLPVRAGQQIISGTSDPDIYIVTEIYQRTGGTDASPTWSSTPREQKGVYAVGTIWSVTLNGPLQAYDRIVARALKTQNSVPCGAAGGNLASVEVTVVQPNTPPVAQSQVVAVTEDTPKNIVVGATDPENDALTYILTSAPTHGALSGTLPNVTYTPALNYFGSDNFIVQASDGIFNSVTPGTVTINISAVNDAPIVNSQSVSTPEDVAANITLVANDVDGNSLTYTILTSPANGVLSGTAPNLTYTPNANFNGADNFTFKVNDGTVDSNTGTVSITTTPVADAPIANVQNVTTSEDVARATTLTATDADGNTLTYSVVNGPAHGTLSGTAPNLTYTPTSNYSGSDAFNFKANDGSFDSNIATVSITITPVADAPVAASQSVTTNEDVAKAIVLSANDLDGDALTYVIVVAPAHGVLTGTAPNLTYTPALDYHGPDNFTFKVNDGSFDSNVASVFVTITSVADAPTASAQVVSTNEDVTKAVTLVGTDVDGDALAYSIVVGPSHGTLTGTAPNVNYVPTANYNGADNFTFRVNDGSTNSNIATVSITVNAVNDLPIANAQSVAYDFNTTKNITLTGSDVDGDAITYAMVTGPTNGNLTGTAPNIIYTPDPGYTGSDNFTFKVNDGTVDSNIATVSLFFNTGVNVAPIAGDQSVNLIEDNNSTIILIATDANGDALTYSITGSPAHGSLSMSGSTVTYSPDANYTGGDSFRFTADDGALTSNAGTITITITGVDDVPMAFNANVLTNEDASKPIALIANDPDGDAITYTIASTPTNGTLTGTAPNLTYVPNANYFGSDNFTFYVNDGTTNSNVATVSIIINALGDPPVASDQLNVPVTEDQGKDIQLTATDLDGDPLTYIIVDQPQHGTITLVGSVITYTPATNYSGADSFTFKANDGSMDSNTATVSLVVSGVDDVPIASSFSITTPEDVAVAATLLGIEPDGSPMTYSIQIVPAHGTLTGVAPSLTYTPDADYFGADAFTYLVNDGTTNSNTATVSIIVTSINDLPSATSGNISTLEEVPVTLNLTGTDPDGDALTFVVTIQPLHGVLIQAGATITYTPVLDYFGPDEFTFVANDGSANSNPAIISITVGGVDDLPGATDQSLITEEDVSLPFVLGAIDPDSDPLTFTLIMSPEHGTLSGTAPNLTYSPDENFFGSDVVTYRVLDGTSESNLGTISVTVTPVNDAPIISVPNLLSMPEDSVIQICISVVDVEGDPITFVTPTNTMGGGEMVRDLPPFDFCYVFTPIENFNGPSVWTLGASDASGVIGEAIVTINVLPVNDPPVVIEKRFETKTDSVINICIETTDVEGNDAILLSAQSVNSIGAFDNENTTDLCARYTPKPGFYGEDIFEVEACDLNDPTICATRELIVDVLPKENLPPEFFDDDGLPIDTIYLQTDEDTSLPFCFAVKDPNKDKVALGSVMNVEGGGALTMAPNTQFCFEFNPILNYFGSAIWKITFCDDRNPSLCGELTVVIDITPVNDAPEAVADTLIFTRNHSDAFNLLLNDVDVDGDAVTIKRLVQEPAHGVYDWSADGTFTYKSDRYFKGEDIASYEICDNAIPQLCSQASILIVVEDVPLKPYDAFSPNGDGINDYWRIEGIDYYQFNTVRIFDRYSNLIFVMDGYNNENKVWRGESNHGLVEGVLKEGTFFYSIELQPGAGPIKGFVVLKRE